MQCAILIGGLGTRLGSLTEDCPKPMLSVAGRPFLNHLIENIARFGFTDILLLAGYKASVIQAHFDEGGNIAERLGLKLRVVTEPIPLGTAGALRHAADYLAPEFLLINGDSLFDFNLLDLVTFSIQNPWLARMALRYVEDTSRYGVVTVNENGQIAVMQQHRDPAAIEPGVINGGLYWLKREIVNLIPEGVCSLEHDIFPRLVEEQRLYGREYDGFFLDIGVPEDFQAAQTLLPLRRPAVFFDRDGVLNYDEGYTYRIQDFRWMDGAMDAIRKANDANWFVFVVTNQAGVAHGLYEEDDVQILHNWMQTELHKVGAHIDAFRYCPHHPDSVIHRYVKSCNCRKPNPGMITDLLMSWPVEVEQSTLIGDKDTDLEAAKSAGIGSCSFNRKHKDESSLLSIVSKLIMK